MSRGPDKMRGSILPMLLVALAALGATEGGGYALTKPSPRIPASGAKERYSVPEPPLTPEAIAAGNSCDELIEGFLKLSDSSGYNSDWVFYVLGIFDIQHYPFKTQVEEQLLTGEIPVNIEPMNETVRSKAINYTCNWVARQCKKVVTIPPKTRNSTLFKLSLRSVLEPFENALPNRTLLIAKCEVFLDKLKKHYTQRHISYDFVFVYFLGEDPELSHRQMCTVAINFIYFRIQEENRNPVKNRKWPRYDLFKISDSSNFLDEASLRLEEKLRTSSIFE